MGCARDHRIVNLTVPRNHPLLCIFAQLHSIKCRGCMQVYSVAGSDLCLTGTAEVPLGGMLIDQIIPEEQLPLRMVAIGHCFRAESGSAGAPKITAILPEYQISLLSGVPCLSSSSNNRKLYARMLGAGMASKGLYRVHQFSKVEMFIVSTEHQSEGLLSELCQIEEEMFSELGLHYRVLVVLRAPVTLPSVSHSFSHPQLSPESLTPL